MTSPSPIRSALAPIVDDFVAERPARQRRRHLEQEDFDAIAAAGFLAFGAPVSHGGRFESVAKTTRPIAESLRLLARGDSSVALVSAMHYSVLVFWLLSEKSADPERQSAWDEQRAWAFSTALDGKWWGTCTSEPGSGGDIMATKTVGTPTSDAEVFLLSGDKHFGSGTGMCSYMMTSALAGPRPGLFVLDMTDKPWERNDGVEIIAPWDGHGMTATQSHGLRLTDRPARHGFGIDPMQTAPGSAAGVCCFLAVTLGIVENAMEEGVQLLARKSDTLRSFEQVAWTDALNAAWMLEQAYEGALRATESETDALLRSYQAKTVGAQLAETCLAQLSRAVGGSAFSRRSPLGFWAEDIKALGFLRPPWALAYDSIRELSRSAISGARA